MCFYTIAAKKYNGSLEAAHALIDDDRYNMVRCGAAGQLFLDLSGPLHGCSIAFTSAIFLIIVLCITTIDTEYNGPLEAVHAYIDHVFTICVLLLAN